jgi:hypothetical protein
MASPVGSLCTSIVYKYGNIGVVASKHAIHYTANFPQGSSVAYVPVGKIAGDDLIVVNQRGQQAGLQISDSKTLRVVDPTNGYAEFVTEDNGNASADIPFEFTLFRNA